MRLKTKINLKILEAQIWWLRTRTEWSRYPEFIDQELLGPPDAATKAKLDEIFDSLRLN